MAIPDDTLRELRYHAARRSTLELEKLLARVVEEALEEMGESAVAPLLRLLDLPDPAIENVAFRGGETPFELPEPIRRLIRRSHG